MRLGICFCPGANESSLERMCNQYNGVRGNRVTVVFGRFYFTFGATRGGIRGPNNLEHASMTSRRPDSKHRADLTRSLDTESRVTDSSMRGKGTNFVALAVALLSGFDSTDAFLAPAACAPKSR